MPRVLGLTNPVARARQANSFRQFLETLRDQRFVLVALACMLLLVTPHIVRVRLSRSGYASNKYISQDIESFLLELDEQIQAAGDEVSQMQLRMLRLAAGIAPEHPDRVTLVFSQLLFSISSLGNTLPCVSDGVGQPATDLPVHWTAMNSSGCSQGCFFAANFYSSMEVLPNMVLQLLAVLGSLGGGEHAQRCFVSVYESGSTDGSPALLGVLRRTLDVLGVPNRIVTGGKINRQHQQQHQQHQRGGAADVAEPVDGSGSNGNSWGRRGGSHSQSTYLGGDDRIHFLAGLRNAALEPLSRTGPSCVHEATAGPGSGGGSGGRSSSSVGVDRVSGPCLPGRTVPSVERIIFLNDIFFCAADVRRLLRYESADMACGMDFVPAKLWLLSQSEREAVAAAHLVGHWGLPSRWAIALSHAWLPYKIWKKLYGKTRSFWPWSRLVFYDIWVTRDVSGRRLRNREPYSLEPWTADRLTQGMPFPAYCCWNGLVNLRAEPFLQQPLLDQDDAVATATQPQAQPPLPSQRRNAQEVLAGSLGQGREGGVPLNASSLPGLQLAAVTGAAAGGPGRRAEQRLQRSRLRQALQFRSHRPGECAASECSLLCDDLHAAGYHRVLIDPNVRVVYDWTAAVKLYSNFDRVGPENVGGLRLQPMAPGDARQVEVNWEDDWVPRVKAGARSVECCGIRPGSETVTLDQCQPTDMSGSWLD